MGETEKTETAEKAEKTYEQGVADPPGYDTRLWSLRSARAGYAMGVDFAQGEATISKDGRRK